jgi:hypothetical protein
MACIMELIKDSKTDDLTVGPVGVGSRPSLVNSRVDSPLGATVLSPAFKQ